MKRIKSASVLFISLIFFLSYSCVFAQATMNLGGEISIDTSIGDTIRWSVDSVNESFAFSLGFNEGDTIKMTIQGTNSTGTRIYIESKLDAVDQDSGDEIAICLSGTDGIGIDSTGPTLIFAPNSDLAQTGFIGMIPSEFELDDLGDALKNAGAWDDYNINSGVLNLTNSFNYTLLLELNADGIVESVTALYNEFEVYSASFESFTPFTEDEIVPGYDIGIIITVIAFPILILAFKLKSKRDTQYL